MAGALDFETMIAELEAKKSAFAESIDTAISGLRQAQAIMGGVAVAASPTPNPSALGFMGLSLIEAAKQAIRLARRPLTNAEIAEALTNGGFLHNSTNFTNTVGTAMWRAEQASDRDIVRNGRTWVLREMAPGLRGRRRADDDTPETDGSEST